MLRRIFVFAITLLWLSLNVSAIMAQDIEFAKDLHQHNLSDKAKDVLITIFHNPRSTASDKAKALYSLGQISFEEGRYTVAMEDWEKLVKNYPQSSQAKEITERLSKLREIITQVSDATISSVVARSYIRHGDFWSDADKKYIIDASWMPKVEMAIEWYDRVIAEFPNSSAAEIAYQRKLFTLLGWKEPGRYGDSYGVRANFSKYMPQVLETFTAFEKAFPNSPYLQGFRYQIAQAYWIVRDWARTREWLQKVIDAGKGEQTFYTETAKARLQKIEY